MIITIDGLAGVGKSTIGKLLSKEFGMEFLSSGNLYRAITLYVLNKNTKPNSSIESDLQNIQIEIKNNSIKVNECIFSNNLLRTIEIDNNVAYISQIETVREIINFTIRKYVKKKWIIIDGRDIGSNVLPDADIKFYFFSNKKKGNNENNVQSLFVRDMLVMTKVIPTSHKPKDAIEIDTFSMPLKQQIKALITIIRERFISCESPWQIDAILNLDNQDVIVTSKPSFDNLDIIIHAKFVIFSEKLNFLSHETMIFSDYQIPFIHNVTHSFDIDKNKYIKIDSLSNRGYILQCFNEKDFKLLYHKHDVNIDNVIVSNIHGMKYYKNISVKNIVARAEFIFLQKLKVHPLFAINNGDKDSLSCHLQETISYAAQNFENVYYRFSDFCSENLCHLSYMNNYESFTINSSIGMRGTNRLITTHKEIFKFEIKNIIELQKKYNNISVLLPFVRTYKEAKQAVSILKKYSVNNIGCMIEVPSILYVTPKINSIFDFFIVGTSDFSQLIQGSDRNLFSIERNTIQLIASMLAHYFFPNIQPQKKIFITSEELFNILVHKKISNHIILLKK